MRANLARAAVAAAALHLAAAAAAAGIFRPSPRSTGQLDYQMGEVTGEIHAEWSVEDGREVLRLAVLVNRHPGTLRVEVWEMTPSCHGPGGCTKELAWRDEWVMVTGTKARIDYVIRGHRPGGSIANRPNSTLEIVIGSVAREELLVALPRISREEE